MNRSNETSEIEIETNDLPKNLNLNLISNPQLHKYHSTFEPKKPERTDKRRASVPEKNPENISNEFKYIWLLNHLSKMNLDMNRCYEILEKRNLEDDLQIEVFLNNVLNQYFSDELFEIDQNNENNPKKIFKSKIIAKLLFFQKKQNIEKDFIDHIVISIPEEDDANKKICQICYEKKHIDNYIQNDKMPSHQFCQTCLVSYVREKILSNKILEIKCPDNCGFCYGDEQIKLILSSDEKLNQKYLKFKNIAFISQNPNVRWCVRAECPGYMTGDKDSKKLICDLCNQEMCFLCMNAWHEGQTCEKAMNSEFKKYMERVEVKNCPHCKSKIEKYEGCNHMTCAKCHYQFCWLCLGKYGARHFYWYNFFGCPGMQYSRFKIALNCIYVYRFLKLFLFLIFGILAVVLFLALVPLGALCLAFIAPFSGFYERWKPHGKCASIVYTILFTLVVIILLPIEFVLAVIPGSCLMAVFYFNGYNDD